MSERKRLKPVCKVPDRQDDGAAAFNREMAVDVLARTIWGEARGEGKPGMEAVANVVMNRVDHARNQGGYWWGNSVIEVCQKPYQFSAWNRRDPNYHKLLEVDETDPDFATAKRIARRAISGALDDRTHGASHYHAKHANPYWARGRKPDAVIGNHMFYKLI
jgi:spore germination cell wall hydrolase CwlJ-like protein